MEIFRSGSRRWRGTKEVIGRENHPEIKDLEIKFYNVKDSNSLRTRHDYTVKLSNAELDQLLEARLKRFGREIRDRIVALTGAERDPAYDRRLRELLDQYAVWRAAFGRRQAEPGNGDRRLDTSGEDVSGGTAQRI